MRLQPETLVLEPAGPKVPPVSSFSQGPTQYFHTTIAHEAISLYVRLRNFAYAYAYFAAFSYIYVEALQQSISPCCAWFGNHQLCENRAMF